MKIADRTFCVTALVALMTIIPVASAEAVTSCNVYHTYQSDGRAYIYVFNENGQFVKLYRGGDSYDYATLRNRAQSFQIGPAGCEGKSQYSPSGTNPYKSGVKYPMSKSGLNLSITTTCPI